MEKSGCFERRLSSPDDGDVATSEVGKPLDPRGVRHEMSRKRRQDRRDVSEIGKARGDHDVASEKALSIVERDRERPGLSVEPDNVFRLHPSDVRLLEPTSVSSKIGHRTWLECLKTARLGIVRKGIARLR